MGKNILYKHDSYADYAQSQSGLYVPKRLKRKFPTCFDCYAGCGGLSLGMIQAGFEVVGAVEWDFDASQTYMVNLGGTPMNIHFPDGESRKEEFDTHLKKQWKRSGFDIDNLEDDGRKKKLILPSEFTHGFPSIAGTGWIQTEREHGRFFPPVRNFWLGDIRKLTGKMVFEATGLQAGELDCVVGGPPCQGFSKAGKQDPGDPRNSMIFEFARVILELNPKTFMMEEVPAFVKMRTPDGIPFLDAFTQIINDGDFAGFEALRSAYKHSKAGAIVFRERQSKKNPKPNSKPEHPTKIKLVKPSHMKKAIKQLSFID